MDLPWIFHTDPGCDEPIHRTEIGGAMAALAATGPWSGSTVMDCGCIMTLCHPNGDPISDAPTLTINGQKPNRAQRRAKHSRRRR